MCFLCACVSSHFSLQINKPVIPAPEQFTSNKQGWKTVVWPKISSRKAHSCACPGGPGQGCARLPCPLRYRSWVPSAPLRIPPCPSSSCGAEGPCQAAEPQKTLPVPLPTLPVRSQPEVEHGTGVHQQRPAGETGKWGRGRRGGWREGSEDGDGRQGHGERESGKGSEDGGGTSGMVKGG